MNKHWLLPPVYHRKCSLKCHINLEHKLASNPLSLCCVTPIYSSHSRLCGRRTGLTSWVSSKRRRAVILPRQSLYWSCWQISAFSCRSRERDNKKAKELGAFPVPDRTRAEWRSGGSWGLRDDPNGRHVVQNSCLIEVGVSKTGFSPNKQPNNRIAKQLKLTVNISAGASSLLKGHRVHSHYIQGSLLEQTWVVILSLPMTMSWCSAAYDRRLLNESDGERTKSPSARLFEMQTLSGVSLLFLFIIHSTLCCF